MCTRHTGDDERMDDMPPLRIAVINAAFSDDEEEYVTGNVGRLIVRAGTTLICGGCGGCR